MTTNRDTAAIARIDELLDLQQVSDPTESFSRIQNLLHSPRTLCGFVYGSGGVPESGADDDDQIVTLQSFAERADRHSQRPSE